MGDALELVLILLASAVFVVVLFRWLHLPPLLGYILVGVAVGPFALAWIPDTDEGRHLAEFGVVFLMFSIGLEFSLPKLFQLRRAVFGLGFSQVLLTLGAVLAAASLAGVPWQAALAVGGAIAMSSTAIVLRILAERIQLETPHGRDIVGVLLFQDLAVVPLLIVIHAIAEGSGELAQRLGIALAKATVVLVVLLFVGQKLMRGWFYIVESRRSPRWASSAWCSWSWRSRSHCSIATFPSWSSRRCCSPCLSRRSSFRQATSSLCAGRAPNGCCNHSRCTE